MAVPKRKVSKSRCRSRKANHGASLAAISPCAQCGALRRSHRVCPACGFYRGRLVLAVNTEA